ncbi:hypothetical protein IZ6_25490 [Terrihabitans soli]|uniref:Uncharacterized protein n=1 Tax=Terrihabitans soli TaxID=708113 RepID=A0A6S6QMU6_9HYPH|nr:hypothetical protein [Terrihabitans soli]BCJ91814.1 hypothetical protein IZ6_25490 [Terrihabitans soli]
MFKVIYFQKGSDFQQAWTEYDPDSGSDITKLWTDGAEAAEFCRDQMSLHHGYVFQPRIVSGTEWRAREERRFSEGTYRELPWVGQPWFDGKYPDHYAHVSVETEAQVAYTETEAKGHADRQTRLNAGRYLTKFFSDVLSETQIRDLATEYVALLDDCKLLFTDNPTKMVRVYVNGPHSCMQYPADHFQSRFHPVRVYAAGDLQLAWLERDGQITARCLVWPERKIYGRIYGDTARIEPRLAALGYSNGSLNGARLKRVPVGRSKRKFIAPYIDGRQRLTDGGDFLAIDAGGEIFADGTDGIARNPMTKCERCRRGEEFHEHNGYSVRINGDGGVRIWCHRCAHRHAVDCRYHGDRFPRRLAVEVENQLWSPWAAEQNSFVCDVTGRRHSNRHLAVLHDGRQVRSSLARDVRHIDGRRIFVLTDEAVRLDDGTYWSQEMFAEHGFVCAITGRNYRNCDRRSPGENVYLYAPANASAA